MSSPDDNNSHASSYWPWVLLRAAPALVVALIITFNADHSVGLGYLTFGFFAVAGGAVIIISSLRALRPSVERTTLVVQGALGVVLGAVALVFSGAGLSFLLYLLGAYAVLSGFLELYSGLRSRGRVGSSRDWLFVGGLTVLLAVIVLLIPADLSQSFKGPDGVKRELTASIVVVGLFGAYCAVLSVYLLIAGLSLKWAQRAVAAPAAESGI